MQHHRSLKFFLLALPLFVTLLVISQTENNSEFVRRSLKDEPLERPIIYTFFELRKNSDGRPDENQRSNHEDLLTAWKELWSEAGWEPRILTLEDAKKHPDYEAFSQSIVGQTENVFSESYVLVPQNAHQKVALDQN